jgi:hypothetical protein
VELILAGLFDDRDVEVVVAGAGEIAIHRFARVGVRTGAGREKRDDANRRSLADAVQLVLENGPVIHFLA